MPNAFFWPDHPSRSRCPSVMRREISVGLGMPRSHYLCFGCSTASDEVRSSREATAPDRSDLNDAIPQIAGIGEAGRSSRKALPHSEPSTNFRASWIYVEPNLGIERCRFDSISTRQSLLCVVHE